jgi:SAM-dependent methyltransferase
MDLDKEFAFLKTWLYDKKDPLFFSDLKLKKLGFTFVGSNVYRYALILNILKKYKSKDIKEKCIDFGSYPGQLQEIIFAFLKVKFDLSGLHFDKSFKDHFSNYKIYDFDFEKSIPNDYQKSKEIYNLATSFNTIEHMEYPNKLLDNINYFTKIGGHLILTTDNISTLRNIRRMILGGKSPNENLIKSKLFYHGEWRAHVRILSKDELFFLLNHSGFKVIEHINFNLRAREYSSINGRLIRKRLSFKSRILETIENLFPIYRDHHLVVAKKVINFDELNNLRMVPTNSTDEWISYRYKKFEIFDKTK